MGRIPSAPIKAKAFPRPRGCKSTLFLECLFLPRTGNEVSGRQQGHKESFSGVVYGLRDLLYFAQRDEQLQLWLIIVRGVMEPLRENGGSVSWSANSKMGPSRLIVVLFFAIESGGFFSILVE
ncbi:hypothetical protein CDAR_169431 [Caerostris darwini]|uniref:Uncharacterized protein n=1 Tax=Caerostris darwini TaxID=1538125 RepID=A0AAV4QI86_9ARAC|nr:hypothetical protein CDAR_169431 [Caerostris darwini]